MRHLLLGTCIGFICFPLPANAQEFVVVDGINDQWTSSGAFTGCDCHFGWPYTPKETITVSKIETKFSDTFDHRFRDLVEVNPPRVVTVELFEGIPSIKEEHGFEVGHSLLPQIGPVVFSSLSSCTQASLT